MPRVTKAQLERQLKDTRVALNKANEGWGRMQDLAVRTEIEKDRIEDLYTRVRVAIGGGTGQEPWDIFEKIQGLKEAGTFWHNRSDYWRHEWTKEVDKVFELETPWHERARTKVKAWWNRNQTAVLMYAVAVWIAGLWFLIGRMSAQ